MLPEVVVDYAAYFQFDVSNKFESLQDVIDNILTRLEELMCVLHMIKLKNGDCSLAVTEDIIKYRNEITVLSKKVSTVIEVVEELHNNMDILEKKVEKAETDFGITNDNKIRSFLKPFLTRNKSMASHQHDPVTTLSKLTFPSVLDNFEGN